MGSAATQRVVALVDMDCFYCQVEARLNPELKGKPVAVVQYNQWKGGGIIAVNYEAKGKGVTRGMRGAEAKRLCPDLNLVSVPVLRGKADLSKYRTAGEEVAQIFSVFSDLIQRASIDEAFIDLTKAVKERINQGIINFDEIQLKSTYVIGFSDLKNINEEQRITGIKEWLKLMKENTPDSPEFQLTVGGMIVEEMREQILAKTGFHCSAGIAHNKILAKLVAGLHKPKHQTILPQDNIPELYDTLPIYKIKSLGGKFGKLVSEKLNIKFMSELYQYSLKELQRKFDEKQGMWLYNIARGVDTEPVTPRLVPESIGCCKNFPGVNMLRTKHDVEHWVRELADEISERLQQDLEKNKRRAKLLTVSLFQTTPISRSDSLHTYETNSIADTALRLLKKFNNASASSDAWDPPIKFVGLSVGKFSKEQGNINAFLKNKLPVSKEPQLDQAPETTTLNTLDCGSSSSVASKSSNLPNKSRESTEKSFFLSFLSKVKGTTVDKEYQTVVDARDASKSEDTDVMPATETDLVLPNENNEVPKSSNQSSNELHNTDSTNLVGQTTLCEVCNQSINVLDYFEHLDYHAAVELHSEINGEINSHSKKTINTTKKSLDLKSKRKRLENGKQISKKVKDIKSFFPVITK